VTSAKPKGKQKECITPDKENLGLIDNVDQPNLGSESMDLHARGWRGTMGCPVAAGKEWWMEGTAERVPRGCAKTALATARRMGVTEAGCVWRPKIDRRGRGGRNVRAWRRWDSRVPAKGGSKVPAEGVDVAV